MSTALALASCEAQSIAAAGGQKGKSAAGSGKAAGTAKGFKEELNDCEAMAAPAQQPAVTDGSIPNTEAGMQNKPGGAQGISGICCVIEGLEMPERPLDVAETQTQAAQTMIPADGMVQEVLPDGEKADSTPEQNARMQNTTAGSTRSTPVITQDQILETVGAYIDAAAEAGKDTAGDQAQQTAQTAASPTGEQTQTAANAAGEGMAADDGAENGMTPAEQAEAALAGQTGYAAEKDDSAAGMHKQYDAPAETDGPERSGKQQSAAMPGMDVREPAPVAKDAGIQAAAQAEPEEAAQYTRENVLRIVDKVSTQAKEGRYDFEVELKPEFLGKVSIKLTMEDGLIRMQVKTDDIAVKGMLADQTSSLQNALKEKGITLTSVDVTYESQASLDNGKQPFEQNDGQARQGGTYYAQAETVRYEPAAEPYSYYIGNSSVEFLA